ncbi:hypothetical protein C9374_011889 [Naegleria lovaniensis]|uniref:DOMON domain-containing protein n=1 Tax=Naegleria lovaniensis TaxID=51637 RepID=A0AA88GDU4_NAELO|nr:uncharacterized protein C9374_011889 [Naegleria lovaniensis]KAG2373600.1 hypothetical protein C9374_011889 [Naegleria lovaniensis]
MLFKILVPLFLILSLVNTFLLAQTYSSCQIINNYYKVQWTTDEANNKISAQFTIPSAPGYGAVGFKRGVLGNGMAGATITLGYGTEVNEYYADANSQPTRINNQFLSANTSLSGSTTIISIVRPLSRPLNAPNTYFEFIKGERVTLLFASSNTLPSNPDALTVHDARYIQINATDFFNNNVKGCQTPTPSPSVKPAVSNSKKTNGASSVMGMMNSIMMLILVFIMTFGTF